MPPRPMTKSMWRRGPRAPLASWRWRTAACGAERIRWSPPLAQTAASGAPTSSSPRKSTLKSPATMTS
eukprot:9182144-Alexandrium_andersonii.AAC.1